MKNNGLAMMATISIALGIASMIGYIDPAVCAGIKSNDFMSCEETAAQHLWGFWGFTSFGLATLIAGTIITKLRKRR